MQENSVDEVTDVFLDFGSQQLVESTSTKFVHKHVNQLFVVLRQSESEMDVHVDKCIVLGWTFLDWCIVVYDVL